MLWLVPWIIFQQHLLNLPPPQVRLWAPQLAFTNALGPFQVSSSSSEYGNVVVALLKLPYLSRMSCLF